MQPKRKRVVLRLIEFLSPVVLILIWWFLTAIVVPAVAPDRAFVFPTPIRIGESFIENFVGEGFFENVGPTLGRFLGGFAIAALVGIIGGVLLGVYTTARLAAMPFITFFRSLPGVALIPIVTIFFGLGTEQKIIVVVVASIWPILINAIDGVRSLDLTVRETAAAYQVRGFDRFRSVIVPAALPQIFAGLRISIAIALIVTVVAELFGASGAGGIGYFLIDAQSKFDMPALWAAIVLLGVIGYLLNVLFSIAETRTLAWHRGAKASALA